MRRITWSLVALLVAATQAGEPRIELPPPTRTLEAGFFGTHLHHLGGDPAHRAPATAWPGNAIGALRLWDSWTRWADLQPQRERWEFDRLDAYVEQAERHDARVLYVLGSTPRWASARPDEPCPYGQGCSAEPADFADWTRYVRTVARRYKGRIHDYELWNEPYFSDLPRDRAQQPHAFFSGSVESMLRLAQIARRVLREEDPQARLLSPGFVGGPERLELFLAHGGGALIDGIAYHLYADDERQLLALWTAVRDTLARHRLARLPIVNTEFGFAGPPGGDERSAALLARSLIVAAFAGVEASYQHAWDNAASGMVTPGGAEGPNARAWRRVSDWLLGASLEGCVDSAGGMRCSAQRDRMRLVISWPHHAARVPMPRSHSVAAGARIERLLETSAGRPAASPADAALSPIATFEPLPSR